MGPRNLLLVSAVLALWDCRGAGLAEIGKALLSSLNQIYPPCLQELLCLITRNGFGQIQKVVELHHTSSKAGQGMYVFCPMKWIS